MKNIIKLITFLVLVSISSTATSFFFFEEDCDSRTLKMLARAYALSLDYNNSTAFTSYIERNSGSFSRNGKVTKCAVDFSEKLTDYGAGRFRNDKSLNNSINSLEMEYGLSPSSRGNKGGDLLLLAQELFWLSGVFPSVAKGDYSSYNNTGTSMRQYKKNLMNNLAPIIDIMGLGEFQKNLPKNMQQLNEQAIIDLGGVFYK